MGKCKICGREALPGKDVCMNCTSSQSQRQGNPSHLSPERGHRSGGGFRGGGGRQRQASLPDECIFTDSFYGEDGHLRREVLLESAEKAAAAFRSVRMTQTSLRNFFNALKSMQQRLKTDKSLGEGFLREQFLRFVSHTEYQAGRLEEIRLFRDFVTSHRELAIKSTKEFNGFLEYLTSIMCRIRPK